MLSVHKQSGDFLYQQVIDLIFQQIASGVLAPGDKLPSLRQLSNELAVSIPTVRQAYLELERQGQVIAREKSGYFIQDKRYNPLVSVDCRACKPVEVRCRNLIDQIYDAIHSPDVLPLGIANPCMALPATKTLHRTMKRVMARAEERTLGYAHTTGDLGLRRQLAYRYLNHGLSINPDQILITNGAQEALALALKSVASAGDVIAVESPAYHGLLELIESLGMLALEIETCPISGVSLDALSKALLRHNVAACMFSSSLNNPLGCVSSNEQRKELVDLLENNEIALIEDDVYGDLIYDQPRPHPAQYYSRKGLVLTCSSFSKTVAPGYRIGWLLAGNFYATAHKLKRAISCSSGLLQQMTLTDFIASGDYDRHIKRLLPVLKFNAQRMTAAVARNFPAETCISQPRGGSVIWLQLPHEVDSAKLFHQAINHNISIMPGEIFSAGRRYQNHIRLSYGHPWSEAMDQGVATLGRLVMQQLAAA